MFYHNCHGHFFQVTCQAISCVDNCDVDIKQMLCGLISSLLHCFMPGLKRLNRNIIDGTDEGNQEQHDVQESKETDETEDTGKVYTMVPIESAPPEYNTLESRIRLVKFNWIQS